MDILDFGTQMTLENIWKEQVHQSIQNHNENKTMQILDLGTQMTLENIWKEQVQQTINKK